MEIRPIARVGAFTAGFALLVALSTQPASAAPQEDGGVIGEAPSVPTAADDAASPRAALDDRWLPWLGCWAPVQGADTDRICIVPTEDGEGVVAQTIENDEVTHTAQIFADGARGRLEEAGCEGWETGDWSADGRRIFLSSELRCEGGLTRSSSGVLSILPDGAWLDVEVVRAGERSATRVLRHRPAAAPAAVAADVATRLQEHEPRIAAARSAAGRRLNTDDVVEAFALTDTETVSALLLERGEPFTLDAAGLHAMAEVGVPGEVTDLMIALSFPDDFVIDRGAGLASARPIEPETGYASDPYAFDRFGRRYSSTARYGSCMLYDAYYGMPYGRYGSGYGCPTFGMGYGSYGRYYGLGGWYVGSGRPVVVRVEPQPEPQPGGRLVKGRGYVGDEGLSSTGRRAVRRGSPDNSSTRMGSSRSTGSTSRASSTSSGTRSKATSSSSSSSGRRAVKRKGGGS